MVVVYSIVMIVFLLSCTVAERKKSYPFLSRSFFSPVSRLSRDLEKDGLCKVYLIAYTLYIIW